MKCIFAVDGWRGRPAGTWDRTVVVEPLDADGPTAVLVWATDPPDARDLFGTDVGVRRWVVDERPQWGDDVVPGITRVAWLRRRAPMSRDEFAAHWTDRHAPLARAHHPTLRRYTQNVVVDGPGGFDGIAELGFDTAEDMRERMYDSAEGRRIITEDVARFLDLTDAWRVLGVESRFSNGLH